MEMIIGGAYQGKTAYAENLYGGLPWTDGRTCPFGAIDTCKGMDHFETYIRRCLKEKKDVSNLAEHMIQSNPDVILISTEMGYGVVPVDAFDREYREAVGRVCTKLAAFSRKVHRVVCGVGTVIKGD